MKKRDSSATFDAGFTSKKPEPQGTQGYTEDNG
jgi:hypothetical protein